MLGESLGELEVFFRPAANDLGETLGFELGNALGKELINEHSERSSGIQLGLCSERVLLDFADGNGAGEGGHTWTVRWWTGGPG